MDISSNIVYKSDNDLNQGLDSAVQKYFDISRHYLNFDPLSLRDFQTFLKACNKFFHYKFPENINEYFFRLEEAPLIWICDSPLNKYIKDFYGHNFPILNGVDQYKGVREIYNKWLTNKYDEQKKYFATSIIDFVENYNSRSNFLSNILAGIVLLYDKDIFNPQRSIELFDKSKEIIGKIKLTENAKEELRYLVTLFSGYSYIIQKENEFARDTFEDALRLKSSGISAKFNLALADVRHQNFDRIEEHIKEIYSYDYERINFAIENLSFNLYAYFIENAVFNNLFYYPEFSYLNEKIEGFLSLIRVSNEPIIKVLTNKFELFNVAVDKETLAEETRKIIFFIEKAIKKYGDSDNIYFINTAEKLKNLFIKTIRKIIENAKNKYYGEIEEVVSPINIEISSKTAIIEELTQELEKQKLELKKKLDAGIKSIDKKTSDDIRALEIDIENLPLKPKLNPQIAFKRSMIYNIILSFIVFLMGGCAGYSNNFVHDISELKNLISISLITGIKWGVITFLVGIIVSAFSAGFTILERSNRRQQLLHNISRLKNDKEYKMNHFKKDIAQKEAILIKNFNTPIDENKDRIDMLKKQRETKISEMKEQADKLISEEIKPYTFLLDEEKFDKE